MVAALSPLEREEAILEGITAATFAEFLRTLRAGSRRGNLRKGGTAPHRHLFVMPDYSPSAATPDFFASDDPITARSIAGVRAR